MRAEDNLLGAFGLDAIDFRWTLKDIAAERNWIINRAHLDDLIEFGLVEMHGDISRLTPAGKEEAWKPT